MQNTPETFADTLLAANPTAWPGRREEVRDILVALSTALAAGRILLPPSWLMAAWPKTFPPEVA